jgi:hypothetical protein
MQIKHHFEGIKEMRHFGDLAANMNITLKRKLKKLYCWYVSLIALIRGKNDNGGLCVHGAHIRESLDFISWTSTDEEDRYHAVVSRLETEYQFRLMCCYVPCRRLKDGKNRFNVQALQVINLRHQLRRKSSGSLPPALSGQTRCNYLSHFPSSE